MTSVIFIKTYNWNDNLKFWLNQKLVQKGWTIDFEASSGSFIGTTYLKNVKISHKSGSLIGVEKLTFNIGLVSSIIQNPIIVFDLITMEGCKANYIFNSNLNENGIHQLPDNFKNY